MAFLVRNCFFFLSSLFWGMTMGVLQGLARHNRRARYPLRATIQSECPCSNILRPESRRVRRKKRFVCSVRVRSNELAIAVLYTSHCPRLQGTRALSSVIMLALPRERVGGEDRDGGVGGELKGGAVMVVWRHVQLKCRLKTSNYRNRRLLNFSGAPWNPAEFYGHLLRQAPESVITGRKSQRTPHRSLDSLPALSRFWDMTHANCTMRRALKKRQSSV